MRRSSMVTLTMLPMLASAAVAAAQPAELAPPGMTQPSEPELSPPGMTKHVWELSCEEDPNWELRRDCPVRGPELGEEVEEGEEVQVSYEGGGGGIWRGGFGHYFSGGGIERRVERIVKRVAVEPRPDWRARVESQGMVFHSWVEGGVERHYWGEGTCYEFTEREADAIEVASRELHARCMDAVAHVIERRRYAELNLSELAIELVERSWREREPSLYGRMDLAFGEGVPKLLEYNADTPTSVLEGGVIQWHWRADCRPDADQANTLHERLIARWRELAPHIGNTMHFGHVCDTYLEDEITIGYLRDTATQAGLRTVGLEMDDYGWDATQSKLLDLELAPVHSMFKLYPWEGLLLDELAPVLPRAGVRWIEPAWKMILSNKAILPILWELFPGHPNLLPSSRDALPEPWVRKPLFGREGNNVTISAPDAEVTTPGPYLDRGYIYQTYASLGCYDGARPVIGAWIVGDEYAGIGIRESETFVTNDEARFVPHVVT